MTKEKPKVKSLNVKNSIENVRSFFLKFALKKQTSIEPQETKDKGKDNIVNVSLKGKEPLQFGNKDPMKNNILKNLVKDKHEFAKDKVGNSLVKHKASMMVKDELKDDVNDHLQSCIVDTLNGIEEQGKSKEMNGVRDYGGVRDLIKVKSEVKNLDRRREKGKNLVVKSTFLKTQQLTNNASSIRPKSTNYAGTSSSLARLRKKKLMQTKTIATGTMKIVMEQRKEKRVYFLPGQKHDPPEDRDPLRIFYSTLRDQMPESGMAEFWLMEYGLLPQDQAKKALERKQRRGQTLKYGTLRKSSTPSQLSNGALKNLTPIFNDKGKNKRIDSKSDNDNDILDKIQMKKKLKA